MKKTTILFAMIMTLVLTVFATGCAQSADGNQPISGTGQIILSVNPEIAVHYNKEGIVTKIEGINNDGKTVVSNVNDYIGRDCREVVKDLVKQINEAGYFVVNENGTYNDITIHVVPGSHIPGNRFLDNIADDVRLTASELKLNTNVAVRDGDSNYGRTDYDDSRYGNSNSNNSGYNDSAYGNSDYNSTSVTITLTPNNSGDSGYSDSAYGNSDYNSTTVTATLKPYNSGDSDYNDSAYGNSDYNSTSVTTTLKPNNSGDSDYNDSAYGDSDYNDSAYGNSNNNSGYNRPTVKPTPQPNNNSDYGDSGYSNYGNSGYSGYGDS